MHSLGYGTTGLSLGQRVLGIADWHRDGTVAEYVAVLHQVLASYPLALVLVTEGAIVTNPLLARMVQRAAAESLDSRVIYTPSRHYPWNGCNGHPT